VNECKPLQRTLHLINVVRAGFDVPREPPGRGVRQRTAADGRHACRGNRGRKGRRLSSARLSLTTASEELIVCFQRSESAPVTCHVITRASSFKPAPFLNPAPWGAPHRRRALRHHDLVRSIRECGDVTRRRRAQRSQPAQQAAGAVRAPASATPWSRENHFVVTTYQPSLPSRR